MPRLRAEAGSRPAGESLSFASPKERNQRKGDPTVCVPCAGATGQPAVLGFGGVSLNSRRCASLRHTRALIRQTLRSSAHPEGHRGTEQPHGPLLRSAPDRGRKRLALRSLGRAQQWPEWMLAVRLFGCPTPAGCACDGAVAGWHGRRSAHASCSDSPQLFERSAPARSEFCGAPRNRHAAGLPRSEAQGSQTGGRLFFGDFLLAKQKKVTRTPGDSRPPPLPKACGPISNHKKTLQNQ